MAMLSEADVHCQAWNRRLVRVEKKFDHVQRRRDALREKIAQKCANQAMAMAGIGCPCPQNSMGQPAFTPAPWAGMRPRTPTMPIPAATYPDVVGLGREEYLFAPISNGDNRIMGLGKRHKFRLFKKKKKSGGGGGGGGDEGAETVAVVPPLGPPVEMMPAGPTTSVYPPPPMNPPPPEIQWQPPPPQMPPPAYPYPQYPMQPQYRDYAAMPTAPQWQPPPMMQNRESVPYQTADPDAPPPFQDEVGPPPTSDEIPPAQNVEPEEEQQEVGTMEQAEAASGIFKAIKGFRKRAKKKLKKAIASKVPSLPSSQAAASGGGPGYEPSKMSTGAKVGLGVAALIAAFFGYRAIKGK